MEIKHKIGECPYYKDWLVSNQRIDLMFDKDKNQLCPDCRPIKLVKRNARP